MNKKIVFSRICLFIYYPITLQVQTSRVVLCEKRTWYEFRNGSGGSEKKAAFRHVS